MCIKITGKSGWWFFIQKTTREIYPGSGEGAVVLTAPGRSGVADVCSVSVKSSGCCTLGRVVIETISVGVCLSIAANDGTICRL